MTPFLQYRGSPAVAGSFLRLICVPPEEAGLRIVPQARPAVSPLIRREKDGGLPPGISEKVSSPINDRPYEDLGNNLSNKDKTDI
jgi:hypothetical protein